jgi:hypothetical protein
MVSLVVERMLRRVPEQVAQPDSVGIRVVQYAVEEFRVHGRGHSTIPVHRLAFGDELLEGGEGRRPPDVSGGSSRGWSRGAPVPHSSRKRRSQFSSQDKRCPRVPSMEPK